MNKGWFEKINQNIRGKPLPARKIEKTTLVKLKS
jgi:hypothetical protein